MSSCLWSIGNNKQLSFEIYDLNTTWNPVSGIYIFSYQASPGQWVSLYVGQTTEFSTRLPNHERKTEAIRRGMTHIHALVVPLQKDRDYYEERLIHELQPTMNQQLREAYNY